MITCGEHGVVDGYIVCEHVASGAALPAHLIPPGHTGHVEADLGEALCAACCQLTEAQLNDVAMDQIHLICTGCLSTILGVPSQRMH
jgi:hypothetical protein